MAKAPTQTPRSREFSVEDLQAAVRRIKKCILEIETFDPETVQERWSPEVTALQASIEGDLVSVFGKDTIEYDRYHKATVLDGGPVSMYLGRGVAPSVPFRSYLKDGKRAAILLLNECMKWLNKEIDEKQFSAAPVGGDASKAVQLNKVFIVHGREEGPKHAVARFLEAIHLEPIILHEQAGKGKTVIEKIEEYGDVEFAVVILTPDDHGGLAGQSTTARPRQNVMLELGYFFGRLGRDRVCALKVGEMELPSDFAGVQWSAYDGDGGAWRQLLARELQAAGFAIDWNVVMR